ncbi:hypothetical protein [Schleiferilactobacillus harbinensis]|uniref:DUF4352 domain-containing protein n=1 Tax=Schleiferilactobacillus harbinensis TaxID=304207 RepID=A0ABU7T0B7_9LACO
MLWGGTITRTSRRQKKPSAKPIYKEWWFWLIWAVALCFIIVIITGAVQGDDSSSHTASSAASGKVSKASASRTRKAKDASDTGVAKSKAKTIPIDNEDAEVVSEANFNPNFTDSAWAGTGVKIDRIRIAKIKPFKDTEEKNTVYNGIVLVHFSVTAQRDINFYPTQGTLVTSDGQQVEANMYSSDSFDGEIAKGATKSGNVLFALTKLDNPKDLKTLRLKWDANYDTDNYDDDNSSHTYDVTVNLN